jgi:lincosamide nucleotidyltransferase A/C/D/E
MKKEMTTEDVIKLYSNFEKHGIKIWLDGGWAVDALLGKQMRTHKDLDIVLEQKDAPKAREFLEGQGYKDVPRDDTSPWNFLMGDDKGREVDFHAIVFDEKGNGLYGPPEKGVMFPAESLTGEGKIEGTRVRCISAEYMVKFMAPWLQKHGNKYSEAILALCQKFSISLPSEYLKFKK